MCQHDEEDGREEEGNDGCESNKKRDRRDEMVGIMTMMICHYSVLHAFFSNDGPQFFGWCMPLQSVATTEWCYYYIMLLQNDSITGMLVLVFY